MKIDNVIIKSLEKYKLSIVLLVIAAIIALIVVDKLFSKKNYETDTFITIEESKTPKNKILSDYKEYQELLLSFGKDYTLTEKDFIKNKYLALFLKENTCSEYIKKVILLENTQKSIKIQVDVDLLCGNCTGITKLYLIPIKKNTSNMAKIEVNSKVKKTKECFEYTIDKPIIYLYPESSQKVEIALGKPENVTRSYPLYKNGWQVQAEPSGKLIDLSTNKELYSLYWEGKINNTNNYSDGFVVKKKDLIPFFEEKLSLLGLSYKEQEEFIIYWLEELDNNDYTFIRFMTKEEIEKEMPLEVRPRPTNMIRVWMQYKKVDSDYQVDEQVLTSPSREGFTLVEWGGTQIK